MNINKLLEKNSGIRLDIGCGGNKQHGFVGMDVRDLPGVDIVHDVTMFPWPLPDESVLTAIASHLLEHIPPFQADPKLLGLIRLLIDKGLISPTEVMEYVGIYNTGPMFIAFMDEAWRVLKVGGEFAIAVPHGRSDGFLQDPSHCNAINEARWAYFDPFVLANPADPNTQGLLWSIYKPKPWRIKHLTWSPDANIEVVLVKRSLDEVAL